MRFGGDCGRRFGALTVAAVFGFDFGGASGWAMGRRALPGAAAGQLLLITVNYC